MNYTPQQVLAAVGIGQQTLRYWRKSLPPLLDRQGAACFTFSDLVALKVVQLLVAEAGMAIGAISGMATDLFAACKTPTPGHMTSDIVLVLRPSDQTVKRINRSAWHGGDVLEVVVPLSVCVDELLDSLRDAGELEAQISLPLPLTAVSKV